MKPVLTKRDFVKRYAAGEFGNASPTWNTLEEFEAEGYQGLVHIRNRVAGGPTWYDVLPVEVRPTWELAVQRGLTKPELLYISAMAPTDKTLLQGEVTEDVWGWSLYYTTVAKPMRDALRESAQQVQGLAARDLLRRKMNAKSYDWLEFLLSAYPNHVIEFSTYSVEWGTLPGFNTLFWEVRKY